MLEKLKETVCICNKQISLHGLAAGTGGNLSARDKQSGLIVIKPSGIPFEQLSPENLVVVDIDGKIIEGELRPSIDTQNHLVIYRNRIDIGSIIHTHSPYATAFSILGQPIPAYLVSLAANFGKEIPISDFARTGGEEIGVAVLKCLSKSSAVLLRNHGVYAVGNNPHHALERALLLEEAAKTIHIAMQIGSPLLLSNEDVNHCYDIHTNSYGQ